MQIPYWACLDVRTLSLERNLDPTSFFSLGRYVNEFIQLFHLNSGARLLLEMYCVRVIKPVAFFAICAILTTASTFSRLPFNFYTLFHDVAVVSDLNKHIDVSMKFGEKTLHIGGRDWHIPTQPHL